MSDFIVQLFRCSCSMAVVALLYTITTTLLRNKYSPKGFYYGGLVVLWGFIIPFRPNINISIPAPIHISADELSSGAALLQNAFATSLVNSEQHGVAITSTKGIMVAPMQVALYVWLLGVVIVLLYHSLRHVYFMNAVKRWCIEITEPRILAVFDEMKLQLGITSHLKLKNCAFISSPMLVQMNDPTILLPDHHLSAADLKLVFHHEMIHYQRKDLLYKGALILATAINWFNPAIYLFAKVFSHICEVSCDAEVTEELNDSVRYQYAMIIIGVARRHSKLNTAFSTHFYGGKENMKHRITSIMNKSKRISAVLLFVCLILTSGAGAVFASETDDIPIDPVENTEEYWEAFYKAEEEDLKKTIESFSEEFSNEFDEQDYKGMTITYSKDGITIVDDPSTLDPKVMAVTAVIKYKKHPFYTSSTCDSSKILFYIPKGKTVVITDSYFGGATAKVKYAGKTGYIKKSHLKF